MRRFRPGMVAGTMTDAGLSISQDMADRLNEIVVAYEDILEVETPPAGRLERTDDGNYYAEPEVPETFHAQLGSGAGPAYSWQEVFRTSTGWETPSGGRNSADDGMAREYNSATGLGLLVVLMQRWPNGEHRFVSPAAGDRSPVIECPTTLKVRVRSHCDPLLSTTYISGATVTAVDTAGVLDDVVETTDADGWAELVLDAGGGTFDIVVELPNGCTETIEDVVMEPCEKRTLIPEVAPCCGEVCFEVYDYDTGSPIEGADAPGGPTDAAGVACTTPVQLQDFGGGYEHQITHPDYHPFSSIRVCLPCDCSPDAVANHPTALFPRSEYVIGGLGTYTTNFTDPEAPCYQDNDCLPFRILRKPFIYKRIMYAEFAGPEPIFGTGSGAITLTVVDPDAAHKRWEGVAPSGGYGYKVTKVFSSSAGFVETARERFDFPMARVFLFGEDSFDGGRAGLEFANYVDAGGTIRAIAGHVFSTSGTPGTEGYTEVVLEPERYCPLEGSSPTIFLYAYPFSVVNYRAIEPGGTTQEDICGDLDEIGLPKWCSDGTRTVYPCSFTSGSGRSGACAPVDVSGAFWCGRDCASGPYYGGSTLLATYSVYE